MSRVIGYRFPGQRPGFFCLVAPVVAVRSMWWLLRTWWWFLLTTVTAVVVTVSWRMRKWPVAVCGGPALVGMAGLRGGGGWWQGAVGACRQR
jgi:hypothetical protein